MWIYKLVNKATGKAYIGQTRRAKLRERLSGHKNAHRRTEEGCRLLNNSIRKHGWDAFRVVVLAKCGSLSELDATETAMIASHGTMYPNGYNILDGPANAPGGNPMVMAKRAATMKHPEPRAKIAAGVRAARANRSEEKKAEWIENVRQAQTTPEMLVHRAMKQTQARAKKTQEELAEWNRKASQGMKDRAERERQEKLKGMTEEEGKRWIAKLESTRKWRASRKKVKGEKGWKRSPLASSASENGTREYALITGSSSGASFPKSRPSATCSGEGTSEDRSWMIPSDPED